MGEIRQVFDVKQHPLKYGKQTDLEIMVGAMESRFAERYEKVIVETFGLHFPGFRTPKGTRFFVNGVYEWNAVYLEYDDGEDGARVWLEDCDDEEQVFQALCAGLAHDEED